MHSIINVLYKETHIYMVYTEMSENGLTTIIQPPMSFESSRD